MPEPIANRGLSAQQFRLLFLFLVLAISYVLVDASGLLEDASPIGVRNVIQEWGVAGVVLYMGLFALGQLLYVPGMVFVVAAGLAYGPWWGFAIAMVGAAFGMSVTFYVGRRIGGKPLAGVRRPRIERLMAGLESRPQRSIALMRLVVSTAPWLNYLLALTAVRFRHYFWGSIFGILVPVFATTWFSDWILQRVFQAN